MQAAAPEALTFLYTDMEGSSALWERYPEHMGAVIARHDDLLAAVVNEHHGRVFKHTGDGICAVFAVPVDAVRAAVAGQLALVREDWGDVGTVRVRMGVHTGEVMVHGADFLGRTMNRIGRVHAAAHGEQIVTSAAVAAAVPADLGPSLALLPLGEVVLRGMGEAERVFQVLHPDLRRDFPPLRGDEHGTHRLPADPGELIGRDEDVRRATKAFEESRLVTITGAGGLGKTRLALRVATQIAADLRGAAWWCDLATVAEPGAVAGAVAHAVGAAPRAGADDPLAAAIVALGADPAIVVLDNCEHVLDGAAEVVRAVLAACPDLQVLTTSREALGVPGEWVVGLEPLALPASGAKLREAGACPSVALFARRGAAASASFELTADNVADVAEICRRLDGSPLAIELAAARLRSFTPALLARHLDERLRLLEPRRRGVAERHRNMRAAIAWSYDLLDADEAELFDRLAVFAGSFGLEAAVAVCGAGFGEYAVIDLLDRLVKRSMLVADTVRGETRFRVLELLREYGRERLTRSGLLATVLDEHARYFLALAERAAEGIIGPDEARWVATLDAELAELRALSVASIAAGDSDTAARLTLALYDYAFYRLRGEVAEWALAAVALLDASGDERVGEASAIAAFLLWHRGEIERAGQLLDGLPSSTAGWVAPAARATLAIFAGDLAAAAEGYAAAVANARRAGDRFHEAIALCQVSFVHSFGGRGDAVTPAADALVAADATGSPSALAQAHWAMGLALMDPDPAHAVDELRLAVSLAESVGNRLSVSAAETVLQEVEARASRRPPLANLRAAAVQLEHWVAAGESPMVWTTARRAVVLLARLERHRDAALILGAEQAAPSKLPRRGAVRAELEAVADDLATALGAAELEAATAAGAELSLQALAEHLVAVVDDLEQAPPIAN